MDPRTFLLFSLSLFGADALVATAARPVVGRFGRHAPLIRCAADAEGLCVTDADTAAAARRVQKAASKFGKTQGKLANDWVEEALNGGASKGDTLMAKSLVLFEECVIDDEDGGAKCKELDTAITQLAKVLDDRGNRPAKKQSPTLSFAPDKAKAAAERVQRAAAKFGPEQSKAAKAWAKNAVGAGSADATSLLREEVMLFGECILSEDGSPSKCQELEEAITAFQSMVPQAEAEVEMEPSAYQGGQFAVSTGRRRNNCYPYK